MTNMPIVVITVRSGLIQEVHANVAFVEDWDCSPEKPVINDYESDVLTLEQEKRVQNLLAEREEVPQPKQN